MSPISYRRCLVNPPRHPLRGVESTGTDSTRHPSFTCRPLSVNGWGTGLGGAAGTTSPQRVAGSCQPRVNRSHHGRSIEEGPSGVERHCLPGLHSLKFDRCETLRTTTTWPLHSNQETCALMEFFGAGHPFSTGIIPAPPPRSQLAGMPVARFPLAPGGRRRRSKSPELSPPCVSGSPDPPPRKSSCRRSHPARHSRQFATRRRTAGCRPSSTRWTICSRRKGK